VVPLLTSRDYLAGMQCLRRLYLEFSQSVGKAPLTIAEEARVKTGKKIKEVARQRYPHGLRVDHQKGLEAAVRETRRLLSESNPEVLLGATFQFHDLIAQTDILRRGRAGCWHLIGVSSSSKIKPEHLADIAFQSHVLQLAGLDLQTVSMRHINSVYVYQGGDDDLDQLFALKDVTSEVEGFEGVIPAQVRRMLDVLRSSDPPERSPGRHCHIPQECPFFDFCNSDSPEHSIDELPRLREPLRQRLFDDGILTIPKIPKGYPGLSPLQERVRNCVIAGKPYRNPRIGQELRSLAFPIYFLDFETFVPALPVHPKTKPYQAIPFQWSLHVLGRDGALSHEEFLADGQADPRPRFAESLLKALGEEDPILVYSSYEATVIKGLIRDLPDLSGHLQGLLPRLVDLLPLIREHCYHPAFKGSFSIKSVLPALIPELGYDDLQIQDGITAGSLFLNTLDEFIPSIEKDRIRDDLLRYCERDTLAMVRLYEVLSRVG